MFGPVLSVLLMGMLPVSSAPSLDQAALQNLAIAAPLPFTGSASTMLELSRRLSSSGVLIVDLQSGQTLFQKRAAEPRAMGSLAKLMTALLIVEQHDLGETVTVPDGIERVKGSTVGLASGEQYAVGDLLTSLLVASANDAAVALAHFHAGSEEAFVTEMNARAQVLGLRDTSFANAVGLDDPGQRSTARDIAWLAAFVLRKEPLRARMALPSASILSYGSRTLSFRHTHAMLGEGGIIAGKTGTTDAAGQCLFSLVRQGGREYVTLLFGSHNRYADMRAVLAAMEEMTF
ncbi:MAG: serine hydrolase [Candidatus Peribacteraceae bacterium]|jgi:D-alanyl-D-alanine carboxypeptidase